MLSYFQDIWKCRYFWMSLVQMDLRTRYRRSILGLGWSLLNPILMTVVLCIVFCPMLNVPAYQHAPYMLAGLACWQYLVNACIQGCQAFFVNESYIRQCPLPLAIYPLRFTLGGTFHFLIALGLVLGISWVWSPMDAEVGAQLYSMALASLIPAILLLFVFAWAVSVIFGLINVYFQDTQHLAEVALQMLFYLTPIIYKRDLLQNTSFWWVIEYNPVVLFLDMIRMPLLQGVPASAETFATATAVVALTALSAGLCMSRLSKKLIFQL